MTGNWRIGSLTTCSSSPPRNPKPRIPSREECLALMDDRGMLPNIRSHSLQVARVAKTLASHLLPPTPG